MPQETDAEKIARLERKIVQLESEIERLRRQLEEAPRAVKRQAAPFSRRFPKAHPRTPGRKAGRRYGPKAHRTVPAEVEQTLEAELPGRCPHCGGRIAETAVVEQYHSEIPDPRVERIRFRVHVGRCRKCGRRVQGRHPRQKALPLGGQRTIGQPPRSGAGGTLPVSLLPGSGSHHWRAEQALRPAVVAHKVWGGNRTERGAQTQQILVSLLATCRQRNHPVQAVLIRLLCSPQPLSLDLTVADRPPPRRRTVRCQFPNPAAQVGRARRVVASR